MEIFYVEERTWETHPMAYFSTVEKAIAFAFKCEAEDRDRKTYWRAFGVFKVTLDDEDCVKTLVTETSSLFDKQPGEK